MGHCFNNATAVLKLTRRSSVVEVSKFVVALICNDNRVFVVCCSVEKNGFKISRGNGLSFC